MTRLGRLYFWWLLALLVSLAGCTPEYNWRELTVAEDRAVIAFPSRVQTEQRPLVLDGRELKFSLTASSVGTSVFAVGYAALPADLPAGASQQLTKAVIESLTGRAVSPAPPELIDRALKGEVFELQTSVAQQPSWLMARVLVHQGMLLQVVVSGPKKELSKETAQEFMRSLVLK